MEVITMMKNKTLMGLLILTVFFLTPIPVSKSQEEYIAAKEAYKYVGKRKTVCGDVASTFYAVRSKGQPTFLNLDQPHPNEIFTVVIWGSDRNKFKNPPEISFKGKKVCVSGIIDTYRGKPQIIVRDPDQIAVKSQ
jgi:DNA/RNA endonuclease YhcR with UshA esterase domain